MNKFAATIALALAGCAVPVIAQEVLPRPKVVGLLPKPFRLQLPVELKDYRTPETAIAAKPMPLNPNKTGQTGYLGIHLESQGNRLVIDAVQPGSPAAEAKIRIGDVLRGMDQRKILSVEDFRDRLQSREPGERIVVGLLRGTAPIDVQIALSATSRPMKPDSPQPSIAARVVESDDAQGVLIENVRQASTAERAGLKIGDVIVRLDGMATPSPQRFADAVNARKPGDTV